MMRIQLLKRESTRLFFEEQYQQGLDIMNRCIDLQGNNSQLYVNRALYQYKLGHIQEAVGDLHHSISLDYLNYKAYFNLLALQIQSQDYEQAFKNICCCLSIGYLLSGMKQNNEQMIQKSIEYSFNNKQSRLMKSIYKLLSKKYIQALNQINYALYLHPANTVIKALQNNIYKQINMKEIKSNPITNKQKYTRLQTNKATPPGHLIMNEINRLVDQFNQIVKTLNIDELYVIKNVNKQEKKSVKYYEKEWCVKIVGKQIHINGYSNMTCGKISQESTNQSFNPEINMKKNHNMNYHAQFNAEAQNILDSSISNLSISNISQNSIVKMSRVHPRQFFDVSQCLRSQKYTGQQDNLMSLQQNSNNGSLLEQYELDRNVRVNLPRQMIEGMRQNERVVVSLQKMQVDANGQRRERRQVYELILNNQNSKFQLIKCNK